jgi:hypothetical protein
MTNEPMKITLGKFADFYKIELAKDAHRESEGRRMSTGHISFPPFYWIHENTYQKLK